MLAAVQENVMVSSGSVVQRTYSVEETFDRIDNKLIEAFGEGFRERLSQEKIKRNM